MTDDQALVKVCFNLDADAWHGSPCETLWARPLTGLGEIAAFELENSPFYARGVSYLDVVRARYRDGQYEFTGVVSRGGHSTYRIMIEDEAAFASWWERLRDLGCTYERGDEKLLSLDVPPPTDVYAVYRVLEVGEKEKVWTFEEGHVGHPLRDEKST